jgi:copper chaperone CopZ
MVESAYKIDGMTCGSCAMKIEKAVQGIDGVQTAHVSFKTRMLTIDSENEIDRQRFVDTLNGLGRYTLKNAADEQEPAMYSILVWGIFGVIFISGIFYLVQALGMQSWTKPIEFMTDNWYLVAPLILGFGTQAGLFRAIHLLARHGGGGMMAGSGSVSGGAMLACCMHNLVLLFPILGASGLATFFAAYQTQVFLFSISVTMIGVGYMIQKYYSTRRACETRRTIVITL